MSQFRTYFYDLKTRKEMTDCPFNGKTWIAVSGMVRKNGAFVKDTCTSVEIADYSSFKVMKGHKVVTIADFPGHDAVAVKIWFGPESQEWRKLIAE